MRELGAEPHVYKRFLWHNPYFNMIKMSLELILVGAISAGTSFEMLSQKSACLNVILIRNIPWLVILTRGIQLWLGVVVHLLRVYVTRDISSTHTLALCSGVGWGMCNPIHQAWAMVARLRCGEGLLQAPSPPPHLRYQSPRRSSPGGLSRNQSRSGQHSVEESAKGTFIHLTV